MPAFAERAWLGRLERLLLPAECLLCQEPLAAREDREMVCGLCRSRWRRLAAPQCARCGLALTPGLPCTECRDWPAALARVRSAVWLDEPARRAVHALKYHGWWAVTAAMADVMRGLDVLTAGVTLVPVPLAPRRERQRGYNQSARLAEALGRRTGLPVALDLLERARETPTQTALDPAARRANVARAFRLRRPAPGPVVLVDDVLTTGATLGAAAEAIAAPSGVCVEGVTFARAGLDP